jgi:hypothetical protein
MKCIRFKLKEIILFGSIAFLSQGLYAQELQDNTEQKTQMEKLSIMEGKWKGSGWRMGADRQKHYFDQTEDIKMMLDGTAILIEGIGIQKTDTVHHAVAIINFDKKKQEYNFRSYLNDGKFGDFKMEFIDDKIHWYPTTFIRYIISINENNEWLEIGEINKQDNWYQFFEMKLTKI